MATYTSRKSNGPVLRSVSPSGRFSTISSHHYQASSSSASASAFASSTSSFSSSTTKTSTFFNRSSSPRRVTLYAPPSSASPSSISFSYDQRSSSPGRSFSTASTGPQSQVVQRQGGTSGVKKTCMCSPTNHPGSFKCSFHRNSYGSHQQHHGSAVPYQSNRLNARRSAMTNSLVRIGTVEGDLMKRALSALIRPSSHQQRRRSTFQPKSSRLSVMSMAAES